jgi:hypothetical protein
MTRPSGPRARVDADDFLSLHRPMRSVASGDLSRSTYARRRCAYFFMNSGAVCFNLSIDIRPLRVM